MSGWWVLIIAFISMAVLEIPSAFEADYEDEEEALRGVPIFFIWLGVDLLPYAFHLLNWSWWWLLTIIAGFLTLSFVPNEWKNKRWILGSILPIITFIGFVIAAR